jgi:uracil-DNA glycosylase family 4
MTGFFTKKELQTTEKVTGKRLSCYSCGLYKGDIQHPKMQPFGNFKKKILNIGEFTSEFDDLRGKPFQGKNKEIYSVYSKLGIDIEEDCLNVNSVMCLPLESNKQRLPNPHEINCCRINMEKIIRQHKPHLIVVFGKIALTSIIGGRWKESLDGIEKWRGFVIPDQEYKSFLAPVFSPSYVKLMDKPEIDLVWKQDLENALTYLGKEFPIYKEPKITIINDLEPLNEIKNGSVVSIDYETTGLKPHDKGHRIVCASVAISENEAYAFDIPKDKEKRLPFINLLKNRHIGKMAHNLKFEENWGFVRLGVRVKNWDWDSMIAAHVLDNRSGITGLKFQTYINFGVADYNSHLEKVLQGEDGKNANSKNKLTEFYKNPKGRIEILQYCGLDTIYQYRLAVLQKSIINNILPF